MSLEFMMMMVPTMTAMMKIFERKHRIVSREILARNDPVQYLEHRRDRPLLWVCSPYHVPSR